MTSSGRDKCPAELEPAAHGPFATGGGTARSSIGNDCASLVNSTGSSGSGFFTALLSCFWAPPDSPPAYHLALVATAWLPLTPASDGCYLCRAPDLPAELRFCSWKSWFRSPPVAQPPCTPQCLSPHPESHTMMPASREKSETAELLEMVQKVSDSSRSPSPRAIQSALSSTVREIMRRRIHACHVI